MASTEREYKDRAGKLLESLGVEYEFVRLRRHPAVVVRVGDRAFRQTFPGSAGDPRSIYNFLAELKRRIRQVQS